MAQLALKVYLVIICMTSTVTTVISNTKKTTSADLSELVNRQLKRQFRENGYVSADERSSDDHKYKDFQTRASEPHTSSDHMLPVGFSTDCLLSSSGVEYMGTISTTADGKQCRPWTETEYTDPNKFPDSSVAEASNYCRNPNLDDRPWCSTADDVEGVSYCDIPLCHETCQRTRYGQEYVGDVSVTVGNHPCMKWEDKHQDLNQLPDSTFDEVGNKCRNPTRGSNGPWCYKALPFTKPRTDVCEIPMCKDDNLNGWTRLDDSIFKFNLEGLKYKDAKRACEVNGGYLATITSMVRNELIGSFVGNIRVNTWIGLANDGGKWKWPTGASLAFENWNKNYPSSTEGRDCVQFKQKNYKWENVPCSGNLNYVCEIPLTNVVFPCPSGWTLFDQKCYKLFEFEQTFEDAAHSCLTRGSFITSIKSQEEQNFITAKFGFWSESQFWLGATDRLKTGTFLWLNGGGLSGFSKLMAATAQSTEEGDHGLLFTSGGAWNDSARTDHNKYICQMTACPDGYEETGGDCTRKQLQARSLAPVTEYTTTRGYKLTGNFLKALTGIRNIEICKNKCTRYKPVTNSIIRCVAINYNSATSECHLFGFGRESTLEEKHFSADINWSYSESRDVCSIEDEDRVGFLASDEIHCLEQRYCYREGQCFLSSAYDVSSYTFDGFRTTVRLTLKITFDKTVQSQTLADCISACTAYEPVYTYKKKCAAVVYNSETKTCYITGRSKDNVMAGVLELDDNSVYLERAEGNCALEDYEQLPCVSTDENDCILKGCCFKNGKCFRSRANLSVIEPTPECPPKWFYYSGNCYKMIRDQKRFQAMRKCNQESAFITSVEDQDEQDFLVRAFAKNSVSFWIGADDSQKAGKYLWLDGSQSTFRKWRPGQPDPTQTSDRYVRMLEDGTWEAANYYGDQNVVCKRASCAIGWTWYNDFCYKLYDEKVKADVATGECRRNGASLLTVQSGKKNSYFQKLAGSRPVWIGLSDVQTERKWEWQSGWTGTYTKWNKGEPDNTKRKDCVIMSVEGFWAVRPCTAKFRYICQQDVDVLGFKPYPGKYISGYNAEKITDVSVYECAQICRDFMLSWYDYRCASFDYDTKQRICYISDKNTETVVLSDYLVRNLDFVYFEREIGSLELNTEDCVFPFIYSGISRSTCDYFSRDKSFKWCSKTPNYDTDLEWTICEDYGFCTTVPAERVSLYGNTEYLCRSVGGCWDGKSKCFQSKSQLKRIECTGKCIEVRNATLSGAPNLRNLYYDAAYAEAKSLLLLPDTFWQWMDAHEDARNALLTTQWPIAHETLEGFYLLWKHFGEEFTALHYNLLLATAFNRRDFGMNTHPSFISSPDYWSWWSQSLTFLIDADDNLIKEDLSPSQKRFMAAAQDKAAKRLVEEETSHVENRRSHHPADTRTIPDFSECQVVRGAQFYIGIKSTTKRGHTCQRWDKQQPQDHTQEAKTNDATYFPDPTLSNAANYCRNPTGKDDLWCYITDTSAGYSWDFCDVPICDCRATDGDAGYTGTVSKTEKGYTCQRWDSQSPNSHTSNPESNDASHFPDETLADAANYCRNPDGKRRLWCYVVDGGKTHWDWCNVPSCVDTESLCTFPFTSPRTGIQWSRCAYEKWLSPKEYCIDRYGQELECRKGHNAGTLHDDGCHFPYYAEKGGSPVSHCTEDKVPWCGTTEIVWKKWTTSVKYCLSDYGLGSNQYKWTDTFSDPVKNKKFQEMVEGYLTECQYQSVDELPFPPRDDGMNAFEAISFLKEKAEKYGTYLSRFPTLTAPWPLLLHLIADIPHDECEWIWRRWSHNEHTIPYGLYSRRILHPSEAGCRPSVWNTYTIPRIKEEGGICGQLSSQAKYTSICLGMPANLVGEPAHMSLFSIEHDPTVTDDPLSGPYIFRMYQSLSDELDTASDGQYPLDMHSFTLAGQPVRRVVNLDFERGIVYTINQGYDVFEKARIRQNVFNRLPVEDKPGALMDLVDGIRDTPYYAHIWSDIADFLTGEIFTFARSTVRFPKSCRDVPRLGELRKELKAIADTNFYNKRVFLQTYLDVVTRIVYPASCCHSDSSILPGLKAEVAKMNQWNTKYGDYVRLNLAKCKTNAAKSKRSLDNDDTECTVCETLREILIRNGNSSDNAAIGSFVSNFNDAMDILLNVPKPNLEVVIQFLKDVAEEIPHIWVGEEEWTLTVQYSTTSKKLIELLKQNAETDAAAKLEKYKAGLTDGANRTDYKF